MNKITHIFIVLIATSSFLFGEQNKQISDMIQHYDQLFNSLDKTRKGLSDEQLRMSVDPFISIKNTPIANKKDMPTLEQVKPEPEYALYAILNNRVKINDSWYSIGDEIKEYKLVAISNNSAKLAKNNETLTLNLKKGNENVVISHN